MSNAAPLSGKINQGMPPALYDEALTEEEERRIKINHT
jgi:hypothetical protein